MQRLRHGAFLDGHQTASERRTQTQSMHDAGSIECQRAGRRGCRRDRSGRALVVITPFEHTASRRQTNPNSHFVACDHRGEPIPAVQTSGALGRGHDSGQYDRTGMQNGAGVHLIELKRMTCSAVHERREGRRGPLRRAQDRCHRATSFASDEVLELARRRTGRPLEAAAKRVEQAQLCSRQDVWGNLLEAQRRGEIREQAGDGCIRLRSVVHGFDKPGWIKLS